MSGEWILVYSTDKEYQAELVRQMLANEGIIAEIMNKQDSAYPVFGDIEIYVQVTDILKSIQLIKKFESE